MPIYEYRCKECDTQFEELVTSQQQKKPACPACSSQETVKVLSVIGGISMGSSSSATPCGSECANAGACSAGGTCCQAG
ncbi:MAG: zinc ribbon domain-containing protein [Chitinivibrionales bacterium]|nr:zinc ribbon domain-containing protein [Chitinivibrionales bacterium]